LIESSYQIFLKGDFFDPVSLNIPEDVYFRADK